MSACPAGRAARLRVWWSPYSDSEQPVVVSFDPGSACDPAPTFERTLSPDDFGSCLQPTPRFVFLPCSPRLPWRETAFHGGRKQELQLLRRSSGILLGTLDYSFFETSLRTRPSSVRFRAVSPP